MRIDNKSKKDKRVAVGNVKLQDFLTKNNFVNNVSVIIH